MIATLESSAYWHPSRVVFKMAKLTHFKRDDNHKTELQREVIFNMLFILTYI